MTEAKEPSHLQLDSGLVLKDPRDAELAFRAVLGRIAEAAGATDGVLLQECFMVLLLDAKNRPSSPLVIGLGGGVGVEVHPRDIFREAVRRGAVSLILAHNHPSGEAEPSVEDIELTRRLSEAGKLLGIPVLDHLVLGDGCASSLAERGLM